MKENDVDIALCIAMFRCFNEQLYALKGVHSSLLKKKFNHLVKVAKQYDDEIVKLSKHDVEIDILYDKMMDIMVEIKLQILKENE
jgi:hypothetical protein